MSEADAVFLAETMELAERGRFTCAPNPPVGCVIFRDGRVIGRGFHARTGQGHAEVNAIDDAGGDVAGATVYVSLEPCAFEGRTPSCAQTLIDAAVSRVVVAAVDPHARVSGAGIRMLRQAGIQVDAHDLPEAHRVIAGYVSRELRGRPLVRIKTASSLDGAVGLASGESKWITGEAARRDVQYWRARSDAIITGVDTVLADDPRLNVRQPEYLHCAQPLRVILDSTLRTPATAGVVRDGAPTLIVHTATAQVPEHFQQAPGVTTLGLQGGPRALPEVLDHLAGIGCNEVLVEAGARVCGSFAAARLWDEWLCFIAPKLLGSATIGLADFALTELAGAPVGRVAQIAQIGDDVRIIIEAQHD